jgi:hypothetical protein
MIALPEKMPKKQLITADEVAHDSQRARSLQSAQALTRLFKTVGRKIYADGATNRSCRKLNG